MTVHTKLHTFLYGRNYYAALMYYGCSSDIKRKWFHMTSLIKLKWNQRTCSLQLLTGLVIFQQNLYIYLTLIRWPPFNLREGGSWSIFKIIILKLIFHEIINICLKTCCKQVNKYLMPQKILPSLHSASINDA